MRDVAAYIEKEMSTTRLGGRMSHRDAQTLVLYDMAVWGDEQSHTVRARFPECSISLMAASSSMSGFIVIIRRHGRHAESMWALAYVLAGMAVAYAAQGVYLAG